METVVNIEERANAEEIKKLLQMLTPEEERAAFTFIQGVRLGQSAAALEAEKAG